MPKVIQSQENLAIDLLCGNLFPEFSSGRPKSFLSAFFVPIDPTIEFLLAVLGNEAPKHNLDGPVLNLPLDTLLKRAESGAKLIHDLDVRIARGEITGDLFRVDSHGDQIKFTCNNPGFADFFLLFPGCGKAIQMLIKLAIQANRSLFRPDGFAVGPAFCAIFELLRRDTFNFKKAGEIIGKAISDACGRTIIEISKWGNMDSVDEIAVGEIFFGTLMNACKDRFSGLSENEVR
ncbi:MAG: hypothetical protein ACM3SR_02360, partial [Ignavibacteriales bacterium]